MSLPLVLGCAGLTERRAGKALVLQALALGFRRFDVAPSYGLGAAESILGEALAGRHAEVSITTKVGVPRPRGGDALRLARRLAAPLRAMAPALTRGLGRVAYAGATADRPALTPAAAEASLADSLRRLRADHVAVLLLHEPAPEAITDELVAWLQAQRTAGRAREIGIGVDAPMREAVAAYRPWLGALDVIQAGWSLRGPTPQTPGPRRILHGVVARNLGAAAAETLVAAALEDMPGAEVIVASRSPRRLAAFAAVVGNDQSRAEARDLLTRQRSPLPPPVDADPLA